MEKRFLLVIALFFLFYLSWQYIGVKFGVIKQVPIESTVVEEPAGPVDPTTGELRDTNQQAQVETPAETVPVEVIEPQKVVLENDVLELTLDNAGAVVRNAYLKEFYTTVERHSRIRLIGGDGAAPGEVLLPSGVSTRGWMFKLDHQPDQKRVSFTATRNGVTITKLYELGEGYDMRFQVEVSGLAMGASYQVVIADGLQPILPNDEMSFSLLSFGAINPKMMQITWSEDGDHEDMAVKKLDMENFQPALEKNEWIDWVGVKDTYFGAVFLGDEKTGNFLIMGREIKPGKDEVLLPIVGLEVKDKLSGKFYIGPVEENLLAAADPQLKNLLTYGWAGLLSEWLFHLLSYCHTLTGNWGWAIIILTFFIKLALLPMTIPGIKSSFKMRKLQPEMDRIKKKYSGDDLATKQKMFEETRKLYKREGINPFSSCITMLPQMPVFFAYFSLLRNSLSLRQTEWIWWVQDLSIMDSTYILPIIMGVTMFLSQLAMPMPGSDPTQQKIMKFMPVMFAFMFIGMPAGLILYMITGNVFTLGQSYFMKWRYGDR